MGSFPKTYVGSHVMKDKFLPYKLIGDATYPMWSWFYLHFKGEKDGLSKHKAHWNFIQFSKRMLVERVFVMLKNRFKIILKIVDIPLQHMPHLVIACICLHKM